VGGVDPVVQLGALEPQHAVKLVERHALLEQRADLGERQPQILQHQDVVEQKQLLGGVEAVAGLPVDPRWAEQADAGVVPQRLHRDAGETSERADGKHNVPPHSQSGPQRSTLPQRESQALRRQVQRIILITSAKIGKLYEAAVQVVGALRLRLAIAVPRFCEGAVAVGGDQPPRVTVLLDQHRGALVRAPGGLRLGSQRCVAPEREALRVEQAQQERLGTLGSQQALPLRRAERREPEEGAFDGARRICTR
jgi:hypothetical protein